MPENIHKVLTIGHSTMPLEAFLSRLKASGVTAVADVRSSPFSRRVPHFNREELEVALKGSGIEYRFLGKELGGRPRASDLYCEGVADYEKMAMEPAFHKGLTRVIKGANEHVVVLMCSEHNPLDCHRCLLVSRALANRHVPIAHILGNGRIAEQRDIEDALLDLSTNPIDDMFTSRDDRLASAYRQRALVVAYREPRRESDRFGNLQRRDHAR